MQPFHQQPRSAEPISAKRRVASILVPVFLAMAVATACTFASAQTTTPLTLPQAVSMALEKNPLHKAAVADVRIGTAAIRESRAPLMPKITFTESVMRGNDPVFVFGSRLRQQNFTVADFALNRLNTPTPISNFSSRFAGEWNLFDGLQSWYAVSRAKYMKQAAEQQLDRNEQELVYHAVEAYYGTLLAQRQVQVAEAGLETAQAIEDSSRARVESGMVVESDLLSAQVATAARKQELIAARNGLALAHTQLALAMGVSSDSLFEPQEALTDRSFSPPPVAELEVIAIEKRPDLKRMESERSAQAKNIAIAKGAFAPRLNAFGSWETDSPSPGWNGGNNWIAGAELQFDLFNGDSKRANLAMRKALQQRAEALRDSYRDQVRLQVRKAYYDYDSAQQQVAVARTAVAQAEESLRINQNRYDGGLSAISDLLRVQESTLRTKADYWQAVYRVQTSYAGVEFATGSISASSPVVTQ